MSTVRLTMIDHHNFRPIYRMTDEELRSQVDEIKINLDHAKELGFDSYLLFSRGFEFLVTYDFKTPTLGDMTRKVFTEESDHRKRQVDYAVLFNEILDYAEKCGVDIIFHSNQFEFPDELFDFAGEKVRTGDRVCTGKPATREAFGAKFVKFFTRFPKCAGIQLTFSESLQGLGGCNCEACAHISDGERIAMMVNEVYNRVSPMGKEVSVRTWGGFETSGVVDMIDENVVLSTKVTHQDFFLTSPDSLLIGKNAGSQEVEFDGWGEYFGYDYYPCYEGERFARQIAKCKEAGVRRLAVRVNWEHFVNHIFSRPWGNAANIYVFSCLAREKDIDHLACLRDYISLTYPDSAKNKAEHIFLTSRDIMLSWMTWRGENANNHSMVYKRSRRGTYHKATDYWAGRAIGTNCKTEDTVAKNYDLVFAQVRERRSEIEDRYKEACEIVKGLPEDVPAEWKREMLRGARTLQYVARINNQCAGLAAAQDYFEEYGEMPDYSEIRENLLATDRKWREDDQEMYDWMLGDGGVQMLKETEDRMEDAK